MATKVQQGGMIQATAARAVPSPTAARQRALDATVRYLTLIYDLPQTRFAWVGNGLGVWIVGDRQRTYFVRVGGELGEVAEAKCLLPFADLQNNDKVLIRKEHPGGLGGYVIIDWYSRGTFPIIFCQILTGGIWYLYTQIEDLQLLDAVSPANALTVVNWHAVYASADVAQFISPSTEDEVVLVGQVGDALKLYHSADRGTTWNLITSYVNDITPSKARFDDSNRERGWQVTFEDLTSVNRAELYGAYPVPGVGYTPFAAGDYYFPRDYQPLTLHLTVDGGLTWTDAVLEFFGDTYGYWIAPAVASSFSGDPGGFCFFFPGSSAAHSSDSGDCEADPASGEISGFVVCAGFVFGDPGIFASACQHAWVAPLHDDQHAYVTAGLTLYNSETFENECYPADARFRYTNQLYLVDTAGAVVDSFQFETDGPTVRDFFTSIETDTLNTELMYAVCSKTYDFSGGTNTQSGKLFRMDWGAHTGVDISPHNPFVDLLYRVLSASTGTLFAPVTEGFLGIRHLVIYRSVDNGDTWTSQDLTDDLGMSYSIYPLLAEARYGSFPGTLAISTRDGRVAYSDDDGLTWNATAPVLDGTLNESGTHLQDVGA